MDTEALVRDWLRHMRASRSQTALSRRLGYSTNVVYTWESGRRSPRACEFFRCAERVGVDVPACAARFFSSEPGWLRDTPLSTAAGITRLVNELRGATPIRELAARCGHSRHAVSRWTRGQAQPRIHELVAYIDAATDRLLDFVSGFVDPALLPSVSDRWTELEGSRQLLVLQPWTHAIVLALELPAYRRLPAHLPGWLSRTLGIERQTEERCIEELVRTGVIKMQGSHYSVQGELTLDTRRTPDAGRRLQAHWAQTAVERIEAKQPGRWSFNVFTVSRADLARIEALHLEYFRTVRAIVADSEPEVAAAMNVHLFELANTPE